MQDKSNQAGIFTKIFNWCKEDPLLKIGALFVLLSIGWFLKNTFSSGLIGPVGQITIGFLVGAGLLVAGNKFTKSKPNVSTAFTLIGGLTILATAFTSRHIYDLLDPTAAFGIMVLAIIYMSSQAVKNNQYPISLIALLGGGVIPILTNSPTPNYISLLTYVFVLNLGTQIVSLNKGWRSLSIISLLITFIYSFSFFEIYPEQDTTVWMFMGLFYLQFLYNNISNIIKKQSIQIADIIGSLFNGLIIIIWIMNLTPEHIQNFLFCGLGLMGIGISYFMQKNAQFKNIFYTFLGLSLLYLGIATAQTFDGTTLATVFALEALILVYLSYARIKDYALTHLTSLSFAIPIVMSIEHLEPRNLEYFLNSPSLIVLITIALTTGLASYIIPKLKPKNDNYPIGSAVLGIISFLYSLRTIWLINESLFQSYSFAKGVSLMTYTLVGLFTLWNGTHNKQKISTIIGQSLLTIVTLRLLLTEAWQMTDTYRMLTFSIIGILFIATAFYKKNK